MRTVLSKHLRTARTALPLLTLAAWPGWAAEAPKTASFDHVFSATGEPGSLHYKVLFVSGGAVHHMEIWRDHDRQIKRTTDQAIETYATRKAGDDGYSLKILDLKRHISTQIDRTNLYRIGAFTDWYDLAHGIRHPKGKYQITAATMPAGMPQIGKACRWYDLVEGPRTTHICWDAQARLPLLMAPAGGRPIWRVMAIDQGAIPAATFVADDRNFIRNNANQDIERD